jgi:hypothetical protein
MKDVDQFQFSAGRYPVFPATFVEEAVFYPSHVLLPLSKIRWA